MEFVSFGSASRSHLTLLDSIVSSVVDSCRTPYLLSRSAMVALAGYNHLGTRREVAKDMIVSSGLFRMGGLLIAISRLFRHNRVVGSRAEHC